MIGGGTARIGDPSGKTEMPTVELSKGDLEAGIGVLSLFVSAKLASSNGDARRLIQGNGASLNGEALSDPTLKVTAANLDKDGEFVLRAGKKKFCRLVFK